MRSILEYSDAELEEWVTRTRNDREMKRNAGLQTFHKAKAETRVKSEKKARASGIEVLSMDGILAAFLKT